MTSYYHLHTRSFYHKWISDANWWRTLLIWIVTMILRYFLSSIFLFCVVGNASSQTATTERRPFADGEVLHVWLRLTDDRVITNARYQSVNAETLSVVRGGRLVGLDLQDVVQIRFMKGSSMLQGAAIGAGSGLAAGACVASLVHGFGGNSTSVSTTITAFAVIGGIIGGTIAALEKEGDLINLENLERASKAARICEAVKLTAASDR
jgi:hypothetical protein